MFVFFCAAHSSSPDQLGLCAQPALVLESLTPLEILQLTLIKKSLGKLPHLLGWRASARSTCPLHGNTFTFECLAYWREVDNGLSGMGFLLLSFQKDIKLRICQLLGLLSRIHAFSVQQMFTGLRVPATELKKWRLSQTCHQWGWVAFSTSPSQRCCPQSCHDSVTAPGLILFVAADFTVSSGKIFSFWLLQVECG